jgi:hypothetical protein
MDLLRLLVGGAQIIGLMTAFFKVVVALTVFIMPPSVLLLPIDPG